jgi:hypothetical protein
MKRYWRWLIPKALGLLFRKHPLHCESGEGIWLQGEKNMPEEIHLQKKVFFVNLALCIIIITNL